MSLNNAEITHARELLDDGCSYREAARTIGHPRSAVMKAIPGYGWTYKEAGEFAAACRWRKGSATTTVRRAS